MENPHGGLCNDIEKLRRYAHALVGDAIEADELVHKSLSRALERVGTDDTVQDLQAYLFTILHEVRTEQLCGSPGTDDTTAFSVLNLTLIAPAHGTNRPERRDLVGALASLPEQLRQVVLLVGFAGFGYAGAASVLGIPEVAVMARLSRGREALRRAMIRNRAASGDFAYAPDQTSGPAAPLRGRRLLPLPN